MRTKEIKTEHKLTPIKQDEIFDEEIFGQYGDIASVLYKQIDKMALEAANKALEAVCVENADGIRVSTDGTENDRLHIPFHDLLAGQVLWQESIFEYGSIDREYDLEALNHSIDFMESALNSLKELKAKHSNK